MSQYLSILRTIKNIFNRSSYTPPGMSFLVTPTLTVELSEKVSIYSPLSKSGFLNLENFQPKINRFFSYPLK
jgi:hypothetical protein